LGCLRTAFGVNANRTRPDLGSDTPVFPIFIKKVEIPLSHPFEPTFLGLRTEIDPIAVRRDLERGCGGMAWKGRALSGRGGFGTLA